jgi:hypothetical protein
LSVVAIGEAGVGCQASRSRLMDGENERGAVLDWGLPGSWKAVIEREPPLRVGNQRQGWTERLGIGGANGIMRCRS